MVVLGKKNMDKKTVTVLIIAAIVTVVLVGIEVYVWKQNSFSSLEYSGFGSKQEGIDFCNQQIPPDQRDDCLIGIEARFR